MMPRGIRLDDTDVECSIRKLAAEGFGGYDIAQHLGLIPRTVYRLCHRRGIAIVKHPHKPRLPAPPTIATMDSKFAVALHNRRFSDDPDAPIREPYLHRRPPTDTGRGASSAEFL